MLSISTPFSQTAVQLTTTVKGFYTWTKIERILYWFKIVTLGKADIFLKSILLGVKDYLQLQFSILILIKKKKSLQEQYHTHFYQSFQFCSSPWASFPWISLLLFFLQLEHHWNECFCRISPCKVLVSNPALIQNEAESIQTQL